MSEEIICNCGKKDDFMIKSVGVVKGVEDRRNDAHEFCWAILESLGFDFTEEEIKQIFKSNNYYENRNRLREAIVKFKRKQRGGR